MSREITGLCSDCPAAPGADPADPAQGPRRRGRPAALNEAARRALILDALGRAYAEDGAAGLTMAAVARRAGMSKRTLYSVFGDRRALFEAYLDRCSAAFIRVLPEEAQALPLAERLSLMLSPRPSGDGDLPLAILRVMVAEAPHHPATAERFHQGARCRAIGLVQAELDRAVARGEMRPRDTAAAAALLLDMVKPNVLDHLIRARGALPLAEWQARFATGLEIFLGGVAR